MVVIEDMKGLVLVAEVPMKLLEIVAIGVKELRLKLELPVVAMDGMLA
jgi:hypothetical protein